MSDCILWTGSRDARSGYGRIKIKGKQYRAHRFVWSQNFGPIPDGLCVCHRCDVKLCVNPEHLFLGTPAENHADMCAKKRNHHPRGTGHGMAKLTPDDVEKIRRDIKFPGVSQSMLAAQYGVSQTCISKISRGERWAQM